MSVEKARVVWLYIRTHGVGDAVGNLIEFIVEK